MDEASSTSAAMSNIAATIATVINRTGPIAGASDAWSRLRPIMKSMEMTIRITCNRLALADTGRATGSPSEGFAKIASAALGDGTSGGFRPAAITVEVLTSGEGEQDED